MEAPVKEWPHTTAKTNTGPAAARSRPRQDGKDKEADMGDLGMVKVDTDGYLDWTEALEEALPDMGPVCGSWVPKFEDFERMGEDPERYVKFVAWIAQACDDKLAAGLANEFLREHAQFA